MSPRCRPSFAKPPARASTRSRNSPQVIVNASCFGADRDLVRALSRRDAEGFSNRRRANRVRECCRLGGALHAGSLTCPFHTLALSSRLGSPLRRVGEPLGSPGLVGRLCIYPAGPVSGSALPFGVGAYQDCGLAQVLAFAHHLVGLCKVPEAQRSP